MKKFTKYLPILLCFLLTAGLAACGNDEPQNPEEPDMIFISSNSKQDIFIGYDDTATLFAIEFKATGDWTAEVYPANSKFEIIDESKSFSKVDWLEVNPFAGTAGNWQCDLLTAPNRDSQARYAVVFLNSAKSRIRFEVTQEGMPSGGGTTIIPNPEN